MVSNKLLVSAFATLASLVVVNAGPCKPGTSAASASVISETSTAPFVTVETSTATADSSTTITATENGTSMTMSLNGASTTTANSERSTDVSESETTGVTGSETTTLTSSNEATTLASSTETTTVATTTDGSSTVAETTATTTTVDTGPTNLLINGNFDLGRTSPWQTTTDPAVRNGVDSPFEGQSYGELEFSIFNGEAYNNYVFQTIDKTRLKAGSYELSAMIRVDFATDNINGDGCNSMAVGCYYGNPNMLHYVQGSFLTVSTDSAVNQWTPLITTCSLAEQTLSNYDYISVTTGFSCANAVAGVDAAIFQEVL